MLQEVGFILIRQLLEVYSGIPIGALVGGIIGGSVNSYEYYDVDKFEFGKGEELKRILSIDELNNSSDRKNLKQVFEYLNYLIL